MVLVCPFCGAPETERLTIDDHRFIVFRCLFTPEVDPAMPETDIAEHLRAKYGETGTAYFRGICDRLHLYVTKGEGARTLLGAEPDPSG